MSKMTCNTLQSQTELFFTEFDARRGIFLEFSLKSTPIQLQALKCKVYNNNVELLRALTGHLCLAMKCPQWKLVIYMRFGGDTMSFIKM